MRLALTVFVLMVFLFYQANTQPCKFCGECQCKNRSTVAICTNLHGSVPDCLPRDMAELYISRSPDFTKVGRNDLKKYKNLHKLSIVETGLETLHQKAFKQLDELETIEIVSADRFIEFRNETFSGMSKLKSVKVAECASFRRLQKGIFENLENLQVLELNGNDIREIDEDILDQSISITSIDLSNNPMLDYLPRKVFYRLEKLETLELTNCSLRVLYPEHVMTPYESRSLTDFCGEENNWQCNEMCEFATWLQTATRFRIIAKMGYCSDSEYYRNQNVVYLTPDDVCPQHGSIILQTLYGVLFSCILALTCCFLWAFCAAKYCKFRSCCNDTSSETSRNNSRVLPVRECRNQSYEDTDDQRVNHFSNETILQADCEVGDWNINSIEPPLYEVVVGNDTTQEKQYNSDSDCDIAPPPYDDTETT